MRRISVSAEAYHRMSAMKVPDETFSDLILRLTKRQPLSQSAGILRHEGVEAIRRAIEEGRKERAQQDQRRLDRLTRMFTRYEDEETLAAIRLKVERLGLSRRDVQKLVDEARDEVWKKRYKRPSRASR